MPLDIILFLFLLFPAFLAVAMQTRFIFIQER